MKGNEFVNVGSIVHNGQSGGAFLDKVSAQLCMFEECFLLVFPFRVRVKVRVASEMFMHALPFGRLKVFTQMRNKFNYIPSSVNS